MTSVIYLGVFKVVGFFTPNVAMDGVPFVISEKFSCASSDVSLHSYSIFNSLMF